ncbi:hypothetical protein EJB05_01838, partial [Eragrostis curvula]
MTYNLREVEKAKVTYNLEGWTVGDVAVDSEAPVLSDSIADTNANTTIQMVETFIQNIYPYRIRMLFSEIPDFSSIKPMHASLERDL